MKKSDRKIDLSRAFAAPPDSYARKTRATLDSLEEEPEVKKFSFSMALAIVCTIVLMSSALAAGLTGGFVNTDKILSQPAATDNTINVTSAIVTAENDYATLTVRKAVNNGNYFYVIAEIAPKDGFTVKYSRSAQAVTEVVKGLSLSLAAGTINTDDFESCIESLADVSDIWDYFEKTMGAATVTAQPETAADAQGTIIGGADGPTAVFVAGGAATEETEQPAQDAAVSDENTDNEKNADGQENAAVTAVPEDSTDDAAYAQSSLGIIGGADGPTAIFVASKSGDETYYITDAQLASNSYYRTLGVADITDKVEHADGAVVLAMIGSMSDGRELLTLSMNVSGNPLECMFNTTRDDDAITERKLSDERPADADTGLEYALADTSSEYCMMVFTDEVTLFDMRYYMVDKGKYTTIAADVNKTLDVFTNADAVGIVDYDADSHFADTTYTPNVTIYGTEKGKYYHVDKNCSGMTDAIELTCADISERGLTNCQICMSDADTTLEALAISLAGDGSDLNDSATCSIRVTSDKNGMASYEVLQILPAVSEPDGEMRIYWRAMNGEYLSATFAALK